MASTKQQNLWDDYFLNHVEKVRTNEYVVVKPLRVFKATRKPANGLGNVIASLEIPVGARINVPTSAKNAYQAAPLDVYDDHHKSPGLYTAYSAGARKLRTDVAKVVALASRSNPSITESVSDYDNSFRYVVGSDVRPTQRMVCNGIACDTGIHFFLTLADAKNYFHW